MRVALLLFVWSDFFEQTRAFTSYRKLRASTASGAACRMTYFKADIMTKTVSIGTGDGGSGSNGYVLRARVLRDIDGALICESITDVDALVALLHAHFPAFEQADVARAVHQLMTPNEHA